VGVDDNGFDNFAGTMLQIAGQNDQTCPPSGVKVWFDRARMASRKLYFEVEGVDHDGPYSNPSFQYTIHTRMVLPVLKAELFEGAEGEYEYLVGPSAHPNQPWVDQAISCTRPILWGGLTRTADGTTSSIEMGALGVPFGTLRPYAARKEGSQSTPYGEAGIDVGSATALPEASFDDVGQVSWVQAIPAKASAWGVGYVQAVVLSDQIEERGALTNVLAVELNAGRP